MESPSPWCAAFTPNQIDDLEYLEDLQKYYKSGYGRKLNGRVQCVAVNDMIHHLETNNLPKTVVYFTHSKSVLLLLTALRFLKDSDSPRADNYYSMSHRKWRLSNISPFGSNLGNFAKHPFFICGFLIIKLHSILYPFIHNLF